MHSQLGSFIFEGRKSPTVSSRTYETNYVEHALIENRPTIQRVGEKLRVMNIEMFLDQSFCNPSEVIGTMEESRSLGEILPLIMGDGRYFGEYVIKKMAIAENLHDPQGALLAATLQVELLEFFDPDAETSQKVSDISSGFAMRGNDPQPFDPVIVPIMPESLAVFGVVASNASAVTASSLMESISVAADKYRAKADTIIQKMLEAGDSLNEVLTLINADSASEMYARTRDLETSIGVMQLVISDVVLECTSLITDIDMGNLAPIPAHLTAITNKATEVNARTKQVRDTASSLVSYATTL